MFDFDPFCHTNGFGNPKSVESFLFTDLQSEELKPSNKPQQQCKRTCFGLDGTIIEAFELHIKYVAERYDSIMLEDISSAQTKMLVRADQCKKKKTETWLYMILYIYVISL